MKTVPNSALAGWIEVDPDQIADELERAFPGVRCWHGEYTGSWWALVDERLVEETDPLSLADRIRSVRPAETVLPQAPRFPRRSQSTGAFARPFPSTPSRANAPVPLAPHRRPTLRARIARLLGWDYR